MFSVDYNIHCSEDVRAVELMIIMYIYCIVFSKLGRRRVCVYVYIGVRTGWNL